MVAPQHTKGVVSVRRIPQRPDDPGLTWPYISDLLQPGIVRHLGMGGRHIFQIVFPVTSRKLDFLQGGIDQSISEARRRADEAGRCRHRERRAPAVSLQSVSLSSNSQ